MTTGWAVVEKNSREHDRDTIHVVLVEGWYEYSLILSRSVACSSAVLRPTVLYLSRDPRVKLHCDA